MIDLDITGTEQLAAALRGFEKQLPRELSIAVNGTAKRVQTGMSKQVGKEITAPVKEIKKTLSKGRRATATSLGTEVTLGESKRLSLASYRPKPRQTKKGTSYKISRSGGSRNAPGAFMGPRPGTKAPRLGGHVYKRQGAGRYPIVRLHGPSPWGSYTKNQMRPQTVKDGETHMDTEMKKRIRAVMVRRGLI